MFLDILNKIIVDDLYHYDCGMLPKLQQFIKIVHNDTYISGEYVHFSPSFLLYVAKQTSIDDCDIFDLLVSVYSQKVVEKDENCSKLCHKILNALG